MKEIEKEIIREIEFGHNNQIDRQFSVRDRLKRTGYNSFEYYLWNSNVVTKNVDSIEFSFCGYSTNTTKQRINIFLDKYSYEITKKFNAVYIRQKNYIMYLYLNGTETAIDSCSRYSIDFNTGLLQKL